LLDVLLLARLQFAVTTVYHFFFVPLTLGLSILVAIMHSRYARSGSEADKRMTLFWGKLFLINFDMGVVTGIVQEFQFGMNWSEYSRFVGDIFGAPLAIEALLAFFVESTFLGLWIFGWDKLPRRLHALTIWMVAIGSTLSALWILIANSFMQEPVGYTLRNGRAEMTDFVALIGNPHVWLQFPHVVFSGVTTAGFFVLGISAYRLLRPSGQPDERELFARSFKLAAIYGLVGIALVIPIGHLQGQYIAKTQPMKLAASEALWETESPAALSLFTIGDEPGRRDLFAIRAPGFLTYLTYGAPEGSVQGIKNLQAEYEKRYGPGDYVPPVAITYWSFRGMVGAGFLLLFLGGISAYLGVRGRTNAYPILLRFLPWAIALPYLANSTGWLVAELGRQPWIVFGLMKTENAVSPTVAPEMVLFSLVAFALLYGLLMVADVYLLAKFAKGEPAAGLEPAPAPAY
jgi:cytochrome bd ubiquinol oxidase subunit I